MKKRVLTSVLVLTVIALAMLHLYCQLFDPPTAPEKTDVSVIFKGSNGQIYKGSLIDSVGKMVEIGAALYLPDNFDSLSIKVSDGSSTLMDTVFNSFKDGYFYDTIWVRNTFWTPGGKNVMITPFSKPERLPIIETITIQGVSQNTSPEWSFDTLKKTIKVGAQLFQALSEICIDAETDRLTYTLLPGLPDNDTVIKTTYQFTPTLQDVGTQIVHVKALDPEGSFAVLPIKITIDNGSDDKQPPELTFISPIDTISSISKDTFTIDLICTDASGVASVSGVVGATTFQSNNKNGHYLIAVKGFVKGTTNIVTVTAKDSSASGNAISRNLHFSYFASTSTVTYQKGAGVTGNVPVDTRKYQTGEQVIVLGNSGNLAKSWCTFAGWNTKEDGSGKSYAGGATLLIGNADVVLYALWTTSPTYRLTYNGNGNIGGTVPVDSNNYTVATTVTVKENSGLLTKTGATFAGWNTAADGSGTGYSVGATFSMGNSNTILYAQWKPQSTYTVAYNGNTNTAGAAPVDFANYLPGTTVTVKDNTGNMVKVGFTFAGWNSAGDGSGISLAAGSTFTIGTDVTLYARWTQHPTFTIIYNGNANTSGIVPVDIGNYETGTSVIVKDNTGNMVKTGCIFTGWNTASDGSGIAYAAGVTLPMGSANVTLFAQWTLKSAFTVTYNGNGSTAGVVPTDTTKYEVSATVTVKGNTNSLVRTGFTFTGWNTVADGSGTAYAAGATFQILSADIKLYAQWSECLYTVTYHGNGNTGGTIPPPSKQAYGMKITVPVAIDILKTGHTLYSWNTDSMGTGIDYSAGDQITIGGKDIDLFARWTKNRYKVVYVGNGNDAGSAPIIPEYEYNAMVTVAEKSSLVKTGYTFNGWNRSKTGVNNNLLPGNTFSMGAFNDTLYAQWKVNCYSVIFNTLGGSTVSSVSVNYGDSVPLPSIPSKKSYIFKEWCKDAACTVHWNFPSDKISGDDTLYAKWVIMDVDGNIYTEVKLGKKVWMVENLKVTKYRDKIPITNLTDQTAWQNYDFPAYCWYLNDSSSYKEPYGALYNWYVVSPENPRKVAPEGWHVPSDSEWTELQDYLIANGYNYDGSTEYNYIGKSLATTTMWSTEVGEGKIGYDLSKNNKSGFSAYPSGSAGGGFCCLGNRCHWWSTTRCTDNINSPFEAWHRSLDYFYEYLEKTSVLMWSGESIRCVRD